MKFSINGRKIGGKNPSYIIAEIGVNHDGNMGIAVSLIVSAKSAGADAVKFQAFRTENLAHRKTPQFELLSSLEFSIDNLNKLKLFCDSIGIQFLISVFDCQSLKNILNLSVSAIKIPSGEITNEPLINAAVDTNLPLIISTGMSYLNEVEEVASLLKKRNALDRTAFLHCVSAYPAPVEAVNLRVIQTMKNILKRPAGFSDHTNSITAAAAAVSLGACIIEKHFTYSKSAKGPDHSSSLTPSEFSLMVKYIREAESALGDGVKQVMECEKNMRTSSRRGIYAARKIRTGKIINESDIIFKRPSLTELKLRDVCGKRSMREIEAESPVFSDYLNTL
ncbi:MAG: N-acetylneuraminate synthase family protein [Planctomycetota bacterium]